MPIFIFAIVIAGMIAIGITNARNAREAKNKPQSIPGSSPATPENDSKWLSRIPFIVPVAVFASMYFGARSSGPRYPSVDEVSLVAMALSGRIESFGHSSGFLTMILEGDTTRYEFALARNPAYPHELQPSHFICEGDSVFKLAANDTLHVIRGGQHLRYLIFAEGRFWQRRQRLIDSIVGRVREDSLY